MQCLPSEFNGFRLHFELSKFVASECFGTSLQMAAIIEMFFQYCALDYYRGNGGGEWWEQEQEQEKKLEQEQEQ